MLHLGQNIKLIRGLLGKTQTEFAKMVGENLSNLKTYENTSIKPKVHIRKRIASMAGVSVADLLHKDLTEDDITLKDEKDEKVKLEASKKPKAGTPGDPHNSVSNPELSQPAQSQQSEPVKKEGELYPVLVQLMKTQNAILVDQKNELVDRVRRIETNLDFVAGKAESLEYDLNSGRTVVLQSLSRIEGLDQNQLLKEADTIKASQALAKGESYRNAESGT